MTEPVKHYVKNLQFYEGIQKNLKTVKKEFERQDRTTQRQIILSAHKFAVLSIQTPVKRHEEAFKELEGLGIADTETEKVNYYKSKMQWINHAAAQTEELDNVIDALLAGETDKAHKLLIDNFKGVGAKKAAFTLAIIGYTEKMCIDTNIEQIAGISDPYTGVVVEKYEKQCSDILEQFEQLSDKLPPFLVQWVLFDAQRGENTSHNTWFNAVEKYTG